LAVIAEGETLAWEPPRTLPSHREQAYCKRIELRAQVRLFRPAKFVPFASLIYFSHAENFLMNNAVNSIRDVYEFSTHELQVPTVVLYPGDRWQVGAFRDSSEAIWRYESILDEP